MQDRMPDRNSAHSSCPNCGDLLRPGDRRCPHCGAAVGKTPPVVSGGLMLVKIVLATLVGLIVLPLGACGACTVVIVSAPLVQGGAMQSGMWATMGFGIVLLTLAVCGIWVIMAMSRGPAKEPGDR